jgi:riboflavin synthase
MFTGLIQGVARVVAVVVRPTGRGITIAVPEVLAVGESVAFNGVCCTVLPMSEASVETPHYQIDLLQETCDKTTLGMLSVGERVNYERCVTPTTLLGGHLLQGHVDGRGVITDIQTLGSGTYALQVSYPEAFFPLLVPKGSIAIDGISLTVVTVSPTVFSVHIIPHTWAVTVLHTRQVGDSVNLEYDVVGKYLHHFYNIHHHNT